MFTPWVVAEVRHCKWMKQTEVDLSRDWQSSGSRAPHFTGDFHSETSYCIEFNKNVTTHLNMRERDLFLSILTSPPNHCFFYDGSYWGGLLGPKAELRRGYILFSLSEICMWSFWSSWRKCLLSSFKLGIWKHFPQASFWHTHVDVQC